MNGASNIFVFTAGNTEAREHLSISIINPIATDRVLEHFESRVHLTCRCRAFS